MDIPPENITAALKMEVKLQTILFTFPTYLNHAKKPRPKDTTFAGPECFTFLQQHKDRSFLSQDRPRLISSTSRKRFLAPLHRFGRR